eukprot:4283220-Alexandrium_andersonii.AAC.1
MRGDEGSSLPEAGGVSSLMEAAPNSKKSGSSRIFSFLRSLTRSGSSSSHWRAASATLTMNSAVA